MRLIDETHFGAADARALGVRQFRGGDAVDIDFAAVGMFEQTRDMQKRRLAGAGWRDERDRLPKPRGEFGAFEDFERGVALRIAPIDRLQKQNRMLLVGHYAHSYRSASTGSSRAARQDG